MEKFKKSSDIKSPEDRLEFYKGAKEMMAKIAGQSLVDTQDLVLLHSAYCVVTGYQNRFRKCCGNVAIWEKHVGNWIALAALEYEKPKPEGDKAPTEEPPKVEAETPAAEVHHTAPVIEEAPKVEPPIAVEAPVVATEEPPKVEATTKQPTAQPPQKMAVAPETKEKKKPGRKPKTT